MKLRGHVGQIFVGEGKHRLTALIDLSVSPGWYSKKIQPGLISLYFINYLIF